jgi:hypothetical protein
MVDFADKQGCKTLHFSGGHLEVVRELLNQVTSVDFADKESYRAAQNSHMEVV